MSATTIEPEALARAKWGFAARRVAPSAATHLLAGVEAAVAGDLVLARVERIGAQATLQIATGRPARLYRRDLVVLACAGEIEAEGAALLSAGGLVGRHSPSEDRAAPTRVALLGRLADACGRPITLAAHALEPLARPAGLRALLVVGAATLCGRTTAAASLAHGLTRAGLRTAALKATGGSSVAHMNEFTDAGAAFVADFTDAGIARTLGEPAERIERGLDTLLAHAARRGCEIAVVEIDGGVLAEETRRLIRREGARGGAGVLFAAPDASAAVGGCAALAALDAPPIALCGKLAASPLAAAEAEAATGLAVLPHAALRDPAKALALIEGLDGSGRGGPAPGASEGPGDGSARQARPEPRPLDAASARA